MVWKLIWRQAIVFGVICFFILSVGGSSLYSQDAPPSKKKQEEKKEKKEKKDKTQDQNESTEKREVVITDTDLKQFHPSQKNKNNKKKGQTGSTNKASNNSSSSSKLSSKKVDRTQTEEYWQNLKNRLESDYNKAKEKLEQMQLRLNKVQSQRLIEDKPVEKQQLEEEYQLLLKSVRNFKRGVATLKKQLDDLPDKARRAGVPPGWVR